MRIKREVQIETKPLLFFRARSLGEESVSIYLVANASVADWNDLDNGQLDVSMKLKCMKRVRSLH